MINPSCLKGMLNGGALALAASLLSLPALAATWTIDMDNSTLGFEASVFGSSVPGTFKTWEANVSFDTAALETSSVSVVIDMASADTADGTRDSSLKGDEWFATDEHPQATLSSTAFRSTGDGNFEMDADLTMRGQTNPLTLPFTLTEQGDGVVATGSVSIDRTDYGVGQGDFLTGSTVGLDVLITIDIAATPQMAAE